MTVPPSLSPTAITAPHLAHPLPADYAERVYAGVLGKMIGVYLGRPIEGWSNERIETELGELREYVHERVGLPLIVTDDDLSGTFLFPRAFEEHGFPPELTPRQIGETWLNHLVEGRSILWWGGMGASTEHTAYLRLMAGIPAPESGSSARNGHTVAEQIGAQIFIDGWAMLHPGDPEAAATLARRAALVSHDGEAVHAAVALAVMEALAFETDDLTRLLDAAEQTLPATSVIAGLYRDLRGWHTNGISCAEALARVRREYGYHRYGGGCHVVPNHALILLGLLYGEGDFSRSLTITTSAGWDTDCNAGNLGCLLGLRGGLAALEGPVDWRGPVADRLYLSSADPDAGVSDAVRETLAIVNRARRLRGLPPERPKEGARFSFAFPGSVQGFAPEERETRLTLGNPRGEGLDVRYHGLQEKPARISTPTFGDESALAERGVGPFYVLSGSPSLHGGQRVTARVSAGDSNAGPVRVRLVAQRADSADHPEDLFGEDASLAPGETHDLTWTVPNDLAGPVLNVGLELRAATPAPGALRLERLDWRGAPNAALGRPNGSGTLWARAWMKAVSDFWTWEQQPHVLIQNRGRGLLARGGRDWADYTAEVEVQPDLTRAVGLALRVQGLQRYYALLLEGGTEARLVRVLGEETTLARAPLVWRYGETYHLRLEAVGARLCAWVDGQLLFDVRDAALDGGGVGLVCEEGRARFGDVKLGAHLSTVLNSSLRCQTGRNTHE